MASEAFDAEELEDEDVVAAASQLGMHIASAAVLDEDYDERRMPRGTERTLVQEDGVLKEKVKNHEKARKIWEKRWKLVARREKMFREEIARLGIDPRPHSLRPCPPSHPDITVRPSPPMPTLSSGFIGWRSTHPELSLEISGPLYKSPLHTIEPPPHEDILSANTQFYIHLG